MVGPTIFLKLRVRPPVCAVQCYPESANLSDFLSFFQFHSSLTVGSSSSPTGVLFFGRMPNWIVNFILFLLLASTPSCLGCDFENRIQCRWKSNRHGPLSDGTFIDAWQVKKPSAGFYAYNQIKRDFNPGTPDGHLTIVSS